LLLAWLAVAPIAKAEQYYVIVAGLGGEPRYETRFEDQARSLAQAAERSVGDASRVSVLSGSAATRDALRELLGQLAGKVEPADSLAVFLIGHGSYDGEQYKLNLPGPDIDGAELAQLLKAVPARAQLVVNATSASGAVLDAWAADGRVLITATKSGWERNATRFAEYWATALSSDAADADKNGVITAAEAFDFTARKVADSFESDGTLATEHPKMAGDGAARFQVARLAARVEATPELERLFAQRDKLDEEIAALRERKDDMQNDAYFDQLQKLLLQLAAVEKDIDAANSSETD
jgi:hypothetical protein